MGNQQRPTVVPPARNDSGNLVRRPRKLGPREAWSANDFSILLGLAALLLPAWLIPERYWWPLWRAAARQPLFANQKRIRRNVAKLQSALGTDAKQTFAILQDEKAAIYELRTQDLRSFRPGGWRPKMVLEGEQHLIEALSYGKGAILWSAPFVFNSGPTKIILKQKGYRVSHLSTPKHGYSGTRFGIAVLNPIRCIPENRCLAQRIVFDRAAPSTSMRRMMRALKGGEVVSIVATSTEGSEMFEAPVLGGRLPVAVGAPRLSALTGAPVLPAFTVRDGDRFRIVIEAPIVPGRGESGDKHTGSMVQAFLARSEPWIRRFPEQWRSWGKWETAREDKETEGDL